MNPPTLMPALHRRTLDRPPICRGDGSRFEQSSVLPLIPQLRAGEARALHQGVELGPHDAGMNAPMERPLGKAAIGPGYDIFASDQPGNAHDPFADEFGVFDHIGGMTDDARNKQPVRRQLGRFPNSPFMLMARIGALDNESPDLHA